MGLAGDEEDKEDQARGDRQNGRKAPPAKAACLPRPTGAINLVAVALVHPCCAPLPPLYQHNDTKAIPPPTRGQAIVVYSEQYPKYDACKRL